MPKEKVMKRFVTYTLILLFAGLVACKQKQKTETGEDITSVHIPTDSLKLIFFGDIMMHTAQIDGALLDGGDTLYNFDPPFQYIREYISTADLALANLELTLGGKPYQGYPVFSSPPELIEALKTSGFDVMFLANNHILDRGKKGFEQTLRVLSEGGLKYSGAFIDAQERRQDYPLLFETKTFRIAFLNYTYDTNGIVVSKPNIINYIDTMLLRKDMERAKALHPDFIITYIHWGKEYMRTPSSQQRFLAELIAEHGSDLIVGSHPHVIQPFDRIATKRGVTVPVIYSLGNLISNQRERYRDGGIAFEILLTKQNDSIQIASLAYEPLWVNREEKGKRFVYRIIPVNDYLRHKSKYKLDKKQATTIQQFHTDTHKLLENLR